MMEVILIRSYPVAALLLSGLLMSGCGGAEGPAPSDSPAGEAASEASPAANACSLLTAEEIQEVMGQAPGEPQPTDGGDVACTWPAADSSSPLVQVSVSGSGYRSYEDFVASYQSEFGGEEPPQEYYRPVPGVGTWAMYLSDRGVVQAFEGGKMLEVGTMPADEAKAVALAQKALPRLP